MNQKSSVSAGQPSAGAGARASRGFTLVELMIAVSIVGILVAVAVASYNSATMKSRRGAAQGCLTEGASYMERFYVTNMTYTGATLPACSSDVTQFYTVSLSVLTASTYTVRAVPIVTSTQASDTCGTMTITHIGARTPATGCW